MTRTLPLTAMILILALIGAHALAEDGLEQASLSIPNMVCMSCEMRVEQAVTAVTGVAGVAFDAEDKIATVAFDPEQASLEEILAACDEAGYPATVVEPTET